MHFSHPTFFRPALRSLLSTGLLLILATTPLAGAQPPGRADCHAQEAHVIEVNDGDTVTLRMNGNIYRTRLIGIDAPEMGQRPWGRRAREHLRGIIKEAGWMVYVETDVVKHDKYDRLLVYLRTKQDAIINERILLDGHAILFTIPPNVRYVAEFTRAEESARSEKKGIWGANGLKEKPFIYRKKHPRQ